MSLALPAMMGDGGGDNGASGSSSSGSTSDAILPTASARGALSSCIFAGMLVGGLAWGALGDRLGRRAALAAALLLNAAAGLASAAARSAGALAALRALAGVGVGGSVPVVFSYLIEMAPADARGRYQVGLAAHWMVGSVASAALGWLLIPTRGWRVFLAAASAPAWAAAAALVALLPESPRHLLARGRAADAEAALRRMAAWNARARRLPRGAGFLLPAAPGQAAAAVELEATAAAKTAPGADDEECCAGEVAAVVVAGNGRGGRQSVTARGARRSSAIAAANSWRAELRAAASDAAALLRPPLLGARTAPLLVAYAGLSGGWYSLILWLPEYFKRRGAAVGAGGGGGSDGGNGGLNVYAETLIVAAANLPGNVASWLLVDRLGRRRAAAGALAAAGAAAGAFALAPARGGWALAAACVFNGISVAGWNALAVLAAELFPTRLRATGNGLMTAAGRLSSFAFTLAAAHLIEAALWAPLVAAAALLAAGGAAVLWLPETQGAALDDDGDDGGGEVALRAVKLAPIFGRQQQEAQDASPRSARSALSRRRRRPSSNGGGSSRSGSGGGNGRRGSV